jgi:hypothetical protein
MISALPMPIMAGVLIARISTNPGTASSIGSQTALQVCHSRIPI